MASYARDIYFGVRVEDRATRPLRRIARDMQMLGKQGLARRQQVATQAGIGARTATAARVRAQAELASLQTGSRAFALEKQRAAVAKMDLMNKYKTLGLDKEAESLTKRELRNAAQLSMYAQNRGFPKGAPRGSEARTLLRKAALAEQNEIAVAQQLLYQKSGIVVGALTEQTLAEQRLIAVEGERVAREAQLTAEIETRAMAEGAAAARSAEAIKAVNSFRVDRLRGIATYVKHIGAVLTTVGAVGVFAFAAMGKAAADFSTQVTLASTQTAPVGARSIAQIQKNAAFIQAAIQKQFASGKVIATPQEQTGATYRIFSGTSLPGNQKQQLKEGIELLREFNQVTTANVGLVKLDEVVSAGLTILNRFRVPLKQMPKELNTMQAAVRFGNINLSQFIAAMNTAAPAAQSAGYSFTDVSAAVAFLSRQFTSSRMAATGYARLLQIFARPDIIKGLRGYGVEITHVVHGVHQLLPIQEIAARVVQRFGGNVKAGSLFLQNFFKAVGGTTQGTIQATRVLISYVQHHREASAILRQVTRDHYELKRSLEAAQASPGVRWQEFINQIKALALEIGTGVLPAVAALSDHVRRLASWFNGLSPHTKRAIGYFGALISVFTLLGGIIVTVLGAVASLILVIPFVSKALIGTGAAAGSASIELALVLPVIAALALAIQHFPGLRSALLNEIGPIIKFIGFLVALRLSVVLLSAAFRLATAAGIRFGIVGLASTSAYIGALIGPIVALIAVLIGLQVGIALLKDQIAKSIHYYDIQNGKTHRASKAFEAEARAVGATTAAYNGYLRAYQKLVNQSGSSGPGGKILPGGGVIPVTGFVGGGSGRETPGFGPGTVERQGKILADKTRKAAAALGVVNTQSFKKAYANYLKAVEYERTHKGFKAEMRLFTAEEDLKTASQTPTQYKAAKAAAAALAKTNKKYTDEFIINEAKKVAALSKAARHEKTYAAWKAYYAALDKLQGNATNSQLSAVEKMFNLTDSAANKTTATTKKAADKIKQTYQQVLSNLENVYQTANQQNENAFGTLFSGPYMNSAVTQNRLDWGQVLNMSDLSKDLKSQVKQFEKWRSDITKLRKLGLPKSLVDQIAALGPDAGKKQAELLIKAGSTKAGRAQLAQYKEMWKRGQKDIHDATMADVQSQLSDWRKHGRRIALAIAAGLRDENTVLEKSLRKMIAKAFPELAKKNVHTPARSHPSKQHSTGTSVPKHETHQAGSHKTEYHTHYEVTGVKDTASVKTKLRHAHFQNRSKYNHRK